MGSFKEYYEDVKNSQRDLTLDEEKEIITNLGESRFFVKELIFSIPGIEIAVKDTLSKLKSTAIATESFNPKKTGHNSNVKKDLDTLLQNPSIPNLHACNFRISWLLKRVLPRVKVDQDTKRAINETLRKINKLENMLVESCLKFAVKLAIENRDKLDHEDAIQLANLALVEAAKKFNPDEGTRFNTYAYYKIIFRLKQHNLENPDILLHIPYTADLEEDHGTWLSLEENLDVGRNKSLKEILPDDKPFVDQIVDNRLTKNNLKKILLEALTELEARIIFLRYLSSSDILTYQEISNRLDKSLTKEGIRQIESRALMKLKDKSKLKELLNIY